MAEAVISDIAIGLISKLGSSVLKEMGLWWGLTDELDKLKRTISTIEVVLLHAEEQSMVNPQVKHWLGMLSEAMYDADDLLDEFSTEALRQQVMGGSRTSKKVRLFFSTSNQITFGLKMGHKVKALRQRLDEIAAEKSKFHLELRSVGRVSVAKGRDQTHSSPPEVVIGRDAEKEEIVELLVSSDYQENVSVVPILGIGGLGKTTLAQLVYNDDRIKNHFQLRMWVCVSDDFDMLLLVNKILESASGEKPKSTEMDPLKNRLHEKINGRKYLLVLDDVWNEDLNKWFTLRDLLLGGAKGSKVVITTRLRKVAEMSRPICIHELRGLFEDEAWSLFKQMAFKQGQVPNPSLEEIGRDIVAKCCGVPLAIKTIGGMMYYKDLESEWRVFKNEELSKIDVYREDILPILQLSYNHLPSNYKHCFACCSLYPKDYKFRVEELVHLWMAQGYLKLTDPTKHIQDVGFGYFMDLFRLSFFQDVEKDIFGNIAHCKMHDLIHDLAILVAGDNFLFPHSRMKCINDRTQHISIKIDIDRNSILQDFLSLLKAKRLRTLLPLVGTEVHTTEDELHALFCSLRCLRMLDLSNMGINLLPSSIYKLKHLRYLNISYNTGIKKLADSVTNLQNLEVLKLTWCIQLIQLPSNITKLVNLGHLDNDRCYALTHMPRGIGQLTRLEKLSTFVVAKDNSLSKHCGGLDELHALNNLRGKLTLKNLRYVKNVAFEFKAADLKAKQLLEELSLHWNEYKDDNDNYSANDVANDQMGLEALQPYQSLKGLTIRYYRGVKFPTWLPLLTNLVSICFENCKSIHYLPPFDKLPFLKRLWIFDLTNLERMDLSASLENGESSSFFPSLTDIRLTTCPNLKGFLRCKTDAGFTSSSMEDVPCFPCVSTLEIGGCPNLNYMPLFPELRKLILRKDGIKSLKEILKMTDKVSQCTPSPFYALTQLENLLIIDVEDFPADELLQYLTSLQDFRFVFCKFKSLSSDEKDGGRLWQTLQVLNSVSFGHMPNFVSLPKGLQYVTTLKRLSIRKCCNLLSVPEWMANLNALQHLSISGCPQLSARCKNNNSTDWPKISHIPNISIEHQIIQSNGQYLL